MFFKCILFGILLISLAGCYGGVEGTGGPENEEPVVRGTGGPIEDPAVVGVGASGDGNIDEGIEGTGDAATDDTIETDTVIASVNDCSDISTESLSGIVLKIEIDVFDSIIHQKVEDADVVLSYVDDGVLVESSALWSIEEETYVFEDSVLDRVYDIIVFSDGYSSVVSKGNQILVTSSCRSSDVLVHNGTAIDIYVCPDGTACR